MMITKRITSCLIMLMCLSANAEEPQNREEPQKENTNSTQASNAPVNGPEHFVEETSQKVMSILKANTSDLAKSNELTSVFLNTVDVDFMGKFALGQHWQVLDEKAKLHYLETYKKFMITSYVPKFKKYQGQKLELKGIKPLNNDQYLVQTDIKTDGPNSAPYNVDYRVKLENGRYKVRDIIAEGVSVITTQRSDFGSIIANGGIESLNKELNSKADKSNSAPPHPQKQ
jgi:phospholipid transport system substrate-binding protein